MVQAGRVCVNGGLRRDPQSGVDLERDRIEVDGQWVARAAHIYLMLNKPRGLVTTRSDEQGRQTVYAAFGGANLPWLSPVGRLDKASQGLLLFTNDTAWADWVLDPKAHLDKRYHVHVNAIAEAELLARLHHGVDTAEGEHLSAKAARLLRRGTRNSWLEIVIDEGKNRHIRRLLEACHVEVLQLIRVAIGPLELGSLAKGQYRHLTEAEVRALAPSAS